MDVAYFLKRRTAFLRSFYDDAIQPFHERQRRIDAEEPPYDNPPYSEEDEPTYLEDWMDAAASIDLLGVTCVSILSDSLKIYFEDLRREIGFSFVEEKNVFREGFVAAYRGVLGAIFTTDWTDCSVRFDVIEQVVLARNRAQHADDLGSFMLAHDPKTLRRHTKPFFADQAEIEDWLGRGGTPESFLRPTIEVKREALFSALDEVNSLADWIDAHMHAAWAWRAARGPDFESLG